MGEDFRLFAQGGVRHLPRFMLCCGRHPGRIGIRIVRYRVRLSRGLASREQQRRKAGLPQKSPERISIPHRMSEL
jgi:hypothetical protein